VAGLLHRQKIANAMTGVYDALARHCEDDGAKAEYSAVVFYG